MERSSIGILDGKSSLLPFRITHPSQYLHNRTVLIQKLWKADMYRGGRRIKDLEDRSIMAQVRLIDSISYQDSDGMELVSPSPRLLFSISPLPSYPALLKGPTHSPRPEPLIPLPPFEAQADTRPLEWIREEILPTSKYCC
jgi:hypothetical protein